MIKVASQVCVSMNVFINMSVTRALGLILVGTPKLSQVCVVGDSDLSIQTLNRKGECLAPREK